MLWSLAVLALLGGVLYFTGWIRTGWRQLTSSRSERFTNEGYEAWQSGNYRKAELLFASAVQTDPTARRAQLLLGRMLLQTRNIPKGREVFARLLATEQGALRRETTALYFDTLVGTGSFQELVRFCLAEMPGLPPALQSQWGAAAVEGTRLALLPPTGLASSGPLPGAQPPALEVLLAAQQWLNAGQRDTAEAWLARLDARQLEGSLLASALQLVVKVCGVDRGRHLLALVGRRLDDSELAFNELWLAPANEIGGVDLSPRLINAAFPSALPPILILQRLGRLFRSANPELPKLLAARLQGEISGLSVEHLSAVWLLWELNRAGRRDNPWSGLLSARVGFTVLPRDPGDLLPRQVTGIINRIPLARDTVVSLLMRLPDPRQL